LDLAVQGSYVYWTDTGLGTLMRAPVGGGVATPLVSNLNFPKGVAADATNLYWVAGYGGQTYPNASVLQMPLGGGPISTLDAEVYIGEVSVDSANVYFMTSYYGVGEVPIGGGTVTKYGGSFINAGHVAVAGSAIYGLCGNGSSNYSIMLEMTDGTAVTKTIATAEAMPSGVTSDGKAIYWSNYVSAPYGAVKKYDIGGGPALTLVDNLDEPVFPVSDGTYVYFGAKNKVLRVLASGGAAEVIADNVDYPWHLAVDGTSVYWISNASGTVFQLTPK
jgi:hypothetical protein